MEKEQVHDRSSSKSKCDRHKTIEGSDGKKSAEGLCICAAQSSDKAQQSAEEIDRSPSVDIGERQPDERRYAVECDDYRPALRFSRW